MRVYAKVINSNLALFDLPRTNYGQTFLRAKIFKQLLIYDQLPDDDYSEVIQEAVETALKPDPSFEIFFDPDYENFVTLNRHQARWLKVAKDYISYTDWETKRRNKNNPYFPLKPDALETWEELPDLSRQSKNKPYQFDPLYRDIHSLGKKVSEFTKNYKELKDKDLFRAKVNSILAASKIVFALNVSDNPENFAQPEIALVNIKISMDAYKQANIFLNRLVSSLLKIKWSYMEIQKPLDQAIELAEMLSHKLKERIVNSEKTFILYISGDFTDL